MSSRPKSGRGTVTENISHSTLYRVQFFNTNVEISDKLIFETKAPEIVEFDLIRKTHAI